MQATLRADELLAQEGVIFSTQNIDHFFPLSHSLLHSRRTDQIKFQLAKKGWLTSVLAAALQGRKSG